MESQAETFDEDSASVFELSDQSARYGDGKHSLSFQKLKQKDRPANSNSRPRKQNVPTQDTKVSEAKSKQDSRAHFIAAKNKDSVVIESSESPFSAISASESEEDSSLSGKELDVDPEVHQAAIQWAANFVPPQHPSEIKDPIRLPSGSRGKRKQAQAGLPPSELRAKLLKPYLNTGYQNLLNIDIRHVVAKDVFRPEDSISGSQIGASIWTSLEKQVFFDALARLGKSDLRGIAERVRTKSVLEVHEYVRLLDEGSEAQIQKDTKNYPESKFQLAIPTALEISGECCEVLERAGDAIASHQERYEEAKEKEKWGEDWLLTEDIGRQWSKEQNKRGKDDNGQKQAILNELHPAANLLKLNNWLELSRNVFMNPGVPHEDDNWHSLAEAAPAIRATALEDFHSLVVSFTRRIVATIQFCHMSRRRALGSSKAAVTSDEVHAAINILGLKHNSHEFWVNCPRRCNLQVVHPVEGTEEYDAISYEDVEEALTSKRELEIATRPSRAQTAVTGHSETSSLSSLLDSNDDFDWGSDSGSSGIDAADSHASNTIQRREQVLQKSLVRKEEVLTQDQYIEACDVQASQREEIKLWQLLDQDPPFELGVEPIEKSKIAGKFSGRARPQHATDWRDRVEYWSAWEIFDSPVPKESFEANRKQWRSKKNQQKYRLRRRSIEDGDEVEDGGQSDKETDEREGANSSTQDDSNSSHDGLAGRADADGEQENVGTDESSAMDVDMEIDEEDQLRQQFLAEQGFDRNFKSESEDE